MRVYADTSWWLAYKCRRDLHHPLAVSLFDREPDAQVVWTPWQRVEVFNTLRHRRLATGVGGHLRRSDREFVVSVRGRAGFAHCGRKGCKTSILIGTMQKKPPMNTNEHESEASEVNLAGKRRAHGLGLVSAVVPDGQNAGLYSCGFVSIRGSTQLFLLNRAGWRRLNSQRCGAGFPLTVIHR
jgi:hypothetical protein